VPNPSSKTNSQLANTCTLRISFPFRWFRFSLQT
jgi:hypothetical protein